MEFQFSYPDDLNESQYDYRSSISDEEFVPKLAPDKVNDDPEDPAPSTSTGPKGRKKKSYFKKKPIKRTRSCFTAAPIERTVLTKRQRRTLLCRALRNPLELMDPEWIGSRVSQADIF